jgi:hypothetical protein
MVNVKRTRARLLLLTSFCFAAPAFAGGTATLQYVNPNPGYVMGGVYVNPYNGTIDNQSAVIICDDFNDEVSSSTPAWTANVYNFSEASTKGNTRMSELNPTLDGAALAEAYTKIAYLATQLMSTAPSNGYQRGVISFALWSILAPTTGPSPLNSLGSQARQDVDSLLASLGTAINDSNRDSLRASLTVYSPQRQLNGGPQEFVTVPEASTPVLMAVDLFGLGLLAFFFRRYQKRLS